MPNLNVIQDTELKISIKNRHVKLLVKSLDK